MIKDLKIRIKGVDSIKKITKAMQMVSAATFRKMFSGLAYANVFSNASHFILSSYGLSDSYVNKVSSFSSLNTKYNSLFVLFTSDKGLCGSINSGLVKYWNAIIEKDYLNTFVIGNKGLDSVKRSSAGSVKLSFSNIFKKECNLFDVYGIFKYINYYMSNKSSFSKVSFIYNFFKSPVVNFVNWSVFNTSYKKSSTSNVFNDYFFFTMIFNSLYHNKTSEESSRMSSMEAATQSADDMLKALTSKYNKYRQSVITIELIEIVSGAEAISIEE